jgi:hypothetical protein
MFGADFVGQITPPRLDEEGQQRFLQQVFALWITPEIERRKGEGALPPNFQLLGAQIVFWPDGRPLEVRLNGEMRCSFLVEPASDLISAEKIIGLDDINRVRGIRPLIEEADAGHVAVLGLPDLWFMVFDFRYNSARVAQTVRAAEEFLLTAHASADQNRHRPFVDNLFSSVELMAKTLLLSFPGPDSLKWNHKKIAIQLSGRRKTNMVGGDFAPLLNDLAKLRRLARYSFDNFEIEADEVNRLRNRANELLELVHHQIGHRARQLLQAQSQSDASRAG